jgi:hypothetical protein
VTHEQTIGRIESWGPDRATAVGLDGVAQGSLVEIEGSGLALVTALRRDRVELAQLSIARPQPRATVRAIGPLVTPVGQQLLGRVIDCLGRALDGSSDIPRGPTAPIFGGDPMLVALPRRARLTLGTLVFDLQRVIDVGASLLAVGPGELVHHVMRHQAQEGRICILAIPAVASPKHIAVRRHDLSCIQVTAGLEASAAAQWLVPWTAMAIADSLRKEGRDVVVLLDPLGAWRPHVRQFPERGTWVTQLAQLASRAYAGHRGSVSLIGRVDHLAPAPDGFDAVLDLRRAARGEIEPRATKLVRPPIQVPNPRILGTACVASALLCEHEQAPWLPPHGAARPILSKAMRVRACLRHRPDLSDSTEQIACLLAICQLDELPTDAVEAFLGAYLAELRRTHVHRLAAIRQRKQLDTEDERALLDVASQVARSL